MLPLVLVLLLLARLGGATVCFDMPQPSPSALLPLCGNGALDAGEVCDDGNRIAGDGCNAFCSAFDALAAAGTLAGGNTACPTQGQPVIGTAAVSNARFCDLRAIEAAPDGSYVLLGDIGVLLKYSLFKDPTPTILTRLPAPLLQSICSIGILASDRAILVHDCGTQRFWAGDSDGGHMQVVADFGTVWAPPPPRVFLKSLYDRAARTVVTAGVLLDATQGCVAVHALAVANVTDWTLLQASTTLLATLPCTVYGVYEGAKQWTSMDIRGMLPYLVVRDRCPPTFRVGQFCYAVHLQRPAHLELLRAYLPVEGGIDLQYYANTHDSLFDNALGPPLVRYGGGDRVYTLRGACFQLESRLITADGKSPPAVTLGNTCKRAPTLGLDCATPLNNAFVTDAVVSPVLLPLGLSATHTHQELTAIFGATCPSMPNATATGPLLYQSVLQSVYGNTTPVDFVELPNTLDVVYVTPTSVGLLSSKRIHFLDRTQPGYVRATNLIYCPTGQFGVVGDICRACGDRHAPGYYVSIAWQIQCPTETAAGGVSPPYETFTVLHTPDVTADMLTSGLRAFAESRNVTAPSDVSMLPSQVLNVAADLLDSTQPQQSVILCLIQAAEADTGASLLRANPAEFMTRIVAAGTQLLQASAQRNVVGAASAINFTDPAQAVPMATWCSARLAQGPGAYLQCAVKYYTDASSTSPQGRRLLYTVAAAHAATTAIPHQDTTYTSSTQVSSNRVAPSSYSSSNDTQTQMGPSVDAPAFPVGAIIGISVGVAVAFAAVAAIFCVRRRRKSSPKTHGRFLHPAWPAPRLQERFHDQ